MSDGYFYTFNKLQYLQKDKGEGCILCRILQGDPSIIDLRIYTDELFAVSLNLYPYNPGHLILFPRQHLTDIRQLEAEKESHLARLVKYFLEILERTLNAQGFNLGYNMGRVAGASIEHLHLHLIPRYPNELGFSDLIAGKRVLVEDPVVTCQKLKESVAQRPFSSSWT